MFFLHYLIELLFLELYVWASFSFDSSSTTGFTLRASLLTVLRVVYAIFRLGSGKTMVSILHVDLNGYVDMTS